ncbi:MAG: hypothetical protein JNK04_17170 [Myxococcales bacterium]|nr:hypothetical protein [Myxococcales bacterium]
MKPYFPDPRRANDTSPYRESQPREAQEPAAKPVTVTRAEPPPEDAPVKPGASLTPAEARALIAVDRGRGAHHFRARLFIVPLTYALWRYGSSLGSLRLLLYPMGLLSFGLVAWEIRRVWRRTEL